MRVLLPMAAPVAILIAVIIWRSIPMSCSTCGGTGRAFQGPAEADWCLVCEGSGRSTNA